MRRGPKRKERGSGSTVPPSTRSRRPLCGRRGFWSAGARCRRGPSPPRTRDGRTLPRGQQQQQQQQQQQAGRTRSTPEVQEVSETQPSVSTPASQRGREARPPAHFLAMFSTSSMRLLNRRFFPARGMFSLRRRIVSILDSWGARTKFVWKHGRGRDLGGTGREGGGRVSTAALTGSCVGAASRGCGFSSCGKECGSLPLSHWRCQP